MPFSIGTLFSANRVRSRDILGNAIIGDVHGLVIQQIGSGPPAEPPSVPWRDLPAATGNPGDVDIFNLLTWRTRLCGQLIGRNAERDSLLAWAGSDRPFAIRILSGEGGVGKTRLAAEVAEQLRADGWCAGLVPLETSLTLPITRKGLLVVLDYPESHRTVVQAIFRAVGLMEQSSRPVKASIRILLLSRQDLSWWFNDLVDAGASELSDGQDCVVRALDAAATCALVRATATRLTSHYRLGSPRLEDASVAAWHAREPAVHGLPLFASAAALHAALDAAPTFELGGREIVRALVRRERTRLDRAAEAAGWPEKQAGPRLLGLAALHRELDEPALSRLAAATPAIGLPPADRIVDQIRRLGWWRGTGVPAPQPDLIAAALLHQVLSDRPHAAPAWLAAALGNLDEPDVERLGRLAHDIATISGDAASNALVQWLTQAVEQNPVMAPQWEALLHSDATTFRLAPLAVMIGRSLLARSDLNDEDRAALLVNLSVCLSDAGDTLAALIAIQGAVAIYRRLAAANPARFEPDLASGLNNLSLRLRDAGDTPAALIAIQDAVAIRRRLAAANPERFEPGLASGLNNLSLRLSDAGDTPAALTAIQDAVAIRRRLAAANPERFEPGLASGLNNLSAALSNAGDYPDALTSIQDAVAIDRRLASANPARFEPDLASGLNNLSAALSNAGDTPAALTAIQGAVAICRRLAAANPARFEPALARSFYNLSLRLSDVGDTPAALTAIQDAVAIHRRLAAANPARFEPDLADSLNNLSLRLSDVGDTPAALTAIQDAVAIRRRLAAASPARSAPDLAGSLALETGLRGSA